MAIEAPLSKYRKNNFKIGIAVLVGLAIWFAYDGYQNEKFIQKHTDQSGVPDSTLVFNRTAPPYLAAGALILGVYLFAIKNKKVIAGQDRLVIGKREIAYDSIEKIDKTHFNSKGYFVVTYKDYQGVDSNLKISDRTYDNLPAVLDELIAKIS
ncbi:MAG TPA: hypothetical protein HPP87_01890 [Planctomycetes bacterium]|nr:hypothetical protein [Planctomycetota bacterium]HIJ70098.1 hypothetical protein [Planctomycetota bacterium]